MKIGSVHVFAGAGLLVSGVIAYLATRSVGPVAMTQFTELREGPLNEHLVTAEELLSQPAHVQMTYPARCCPGVSQAITHGFAPLWSVPDPQVAALPSEAMW